jgi:hypothetical protein
MCLSPRSPRKAVRRAFSLRGLPDERAGAPSLRRARAASPPATRRLRSCRNSCSRQTARLAEKYSRRMLDKPFRIGSGNAVLYKCGRRSAASRRCVVSPRSVAGKGPLVVAELGVRKRARQRLAVGWMLTSESVVRGAGIVDGRFCALRAYPPPTPKHTHTHIHHASGIAHLGATGPSVPTAHPRLNLKEGRRAGQLEGSCTGQQRGSPLRSAASYLGERACFGQAIRPRSGYGPDDWGSATGSAAAGGGGHDRLPHQTPPQGGVSQDGQA